MSDSLIAAIIGGAITIAGWFATYLYAKRMDDRRRRLELHLQHRSQQIELLYGPLSSLVEQIFNLWKVREKILTHSNCSPEEAHQVRELIWKQFFAPLHAEIGTLLRTRLYLLEGSSLPQSFAEYLEHSRQEECQHVLRDTLRIDTSGVPIQPWPRNFHHDIETTLKALMEDRQSGLARLR